MELKPIFGRSCVDTAVRCALAIALPVLAVAAVLTGDPRRLVSVVAITAFATTSLLVLPSAVDRG